METKDKEKDQDQTPNPPENTQRPDILPPDQPRPPTRHIKRKEKTEPPNENPDLQPPKMTNTPTPPKPKAAKPPRTNPKIRFPLV